MYISVTKALIILLNNEDLLENDNCTVIPRYNAPRYNADLAITRFFTPKVFLPHLLRKGKFSAKLVNISL